MPSEKCSQNFGMVVKIINFLAGVMLIGLGVYRFYKTNISEPKDMFLSFYYVFFGALLGISECPWKKLMACFHCLTFPLGKSLYIMFLAALTYDIYSPVYLLITIILVGCAVLQLLYLLIAYVDPEPSPRAIVKKKESQDNKAEKFGRIELDENVNNDPPANSEILNRRK